MEENTVDIQSGQVVYRSKAGQTLEKQGYQVTIPVSDQANLDQFVTILRNHQAGQTDFLPSAKKQQKQVFTSGSLTQQP